jgi:methylenetetrahydrofolate reductase (NADPH)
VLVGCVLARSIVLAPREAMTSTAAAGSSPLIGRTLSLELFAPRSTAGIDDLLAPHGRLEQYASRGPAFIGVSGGGDDAIRIMQHIRKVHSIRPQLHLPVKGATKENVGLRLNSAMLCGVRDVLVLASVPARQVVPPGGFATATDLVRWIHKQYNHRLRIAVSGYPRGCCGEHGNYESDLAELARQISAGASLVICLPCFDMESFSRFVADARGVGVDCAIVPGLLPISDAIEFRRITRALVIEPPAWLEAKLQEHQKCAGSPHALPLTSVCVCALRLRLLVALTRKCSCCLSVPQGHCCFREGMAGSLSATADRAAAMCTARVHSQLFSSIGLS